MKKIVLLSGLVIGLSSMGTISNGSITQTQAFKVSAEKKAPRAVLNSFNEVISEIMNTYFPNSSGWDSYVVWTRDQGDWVASGRVTIPNNNAYRIDIQSARFGQHGEFIEIFYTVVIAE